MVGHFRVLLEGIAEDPEQPVDLLPILLPEEERQILLEWNDTATDYPRDRVPARTVRGAGAAARRRACGHLRHRIADLCRLNEQANRLAHWLQELGVGPESLVGVYLERGIDIVVALLGIVKAGGAYLPLDVEYPPERLAFMIRPTAARACSSRSRT